MRMAVGRCKMVTRAAHRSSPSGTSSAHFLDGDVSRSIPKGDMRLFTRGSKAVGEQESASRLRDAWKRFMNKGKRSRKVVSPKLVAQSIDWTEWSQTSKVKKNSLVITTSPYTAGTTATILQANKNATSSATFTTNNRPCSWRRERFRSCTGRHTCPSRRGPRPSSG